MKSGSRTCGHAIFLLWWCQLYQILLLFLKLFLWSYRYYVLHIWYLILRPFLQDIYYSTHFIDEKTEVKRVKWLGLRSHGSLFFVFKQVWSTLFSDTKLMWWSWPGSGFSAKRLSCGFSPGGQWTPGRLHGSNWKTGFGSKFVWMKALSFPTKS